MDLTNIKLAYQHVNKGGASADYKMAFKILNQIIDEPNNPTISKAKIYLGALYCAGKGVERDKEKGSRLIEEGMAKNKEKINPNFYYRLGILYYDGRIEILNTNYFYVASDLQERIIILNKALLLFEKASVNNIIKANEYIIKSQLEKNEYLEKYLLELNNYNKYLHEEFNRLIYPGHKSEFVYKMENKMKEVLEEYKKVKLELEKLQKIINAIEDNNYDW